MWYVALVFADGEGKTGLASELHSTVLMSGEVDHPAIEIAWKDEEYVSVYEFDQIHSIIIQPSKTSGDTT